MAAEALNAAEREILADIDRRLSFFRQPDCSADLDGSVMCVSIRGLLLLMSFVPQEVPA